MSGSTRSDRRRVELTELAAARPRVRDVYEDLAEFLELQNWTIDESKVPMPPPELPTSC